MEEQSQLVLSVRKREIIVLWGRTVAQGPSRELEQLGLQTLITRGGITRIKHKLWASLCSATTPFMLHPHPKPRTAVLISVWGKPSPREVVSLAQATSGLSCCCESEISGLKISGLEVYQLSIAE